MMTSEQLRTHKLTTHGRDYDHSGDGYDDMELAGKTGWTVVSAWGEDGWDLGKWPYVAIYTRERAGKFQLQQIVEGDHDVYEFDNLEDRTAAIDYLFLWYGADETWAPMDYNTRERLDRANLDAGTARVDAKFTGPFSWARCDMAHGR